MGFLDEYIRTKWSFSNKRTLDGLLLQECGGGRVSHKENSVRDADVLSSEDEIILREFGGRAIPSLPGDEIEHQRAQLEREQQNPTADAYVSFKCEDLRNKATSLALIECKYRAQTDNVKARPRKVAKLYEGLCQKFASSRAFLTKEGRSCSRVECVVFNSTAVGEIRDILESLCIGDDRAVFNIVDSEQLSMMFKSDGCGRNEPRCSEN